MIHPLVHTIRRTGLQHLNGTNSAQEVELAWTSEHCGTPKRTVTVVFRGLQHKVRRQGCTEDGEYLKVIFTFSGYVNV